MRVVLLTPLLGACHQTLEARASCTSQRSSVHALAQVLRTPTLPFSAAWHPNIYLGIRALGLLDLLLPRKPTQPVTVTDVRVLNDIAGYDKIPQLSLGTFYALTHFAPSQWYSTRTCLLQAIIFTRPMDHRGPVVSPHSKFRHCPAHPETLLPYPHAPDTRHFAYQVLFSARPVYCNELSLLAPMAPRPFWLPIPVLGTLLCIVN